VPASVLVLGAGAYFAFALLRPPPTPTISARPAGEVFAGRVVRLAWPSQGEAAVGVQGVGLVGSHGAGRPTPIASVAKVMTAIVVLRDHPLRGGASGPQITVSPADVAAYRSDVASGQSVVPVSAGEHLTERQALAGLLLPSGNNVATLLADWDAGSEGAFVARMNAQARALGLADTHYADASGVQASTVSTASDQVRLAMRALELPAFAETVATAEVTLPVAGLQRNRNVLLGKDGIVGIKTGTTLEAGGCLVFAARTRIGGRSVTVVGAVLHQPGNGTQPGMLAAASGATTALLDSTRRVLVRRVVIRRGVTLGSIGAPWADSVPVLAAGSTQLIGWPGLPIHSTISSARVPAPISPRANVGTVVVEAGAQRETVQLVASEALPSPSLAWRLAHP
jgi:serine-type D-Ala-D-Ala carboxypeptidase (penicillin-binding protein 5/6)